MPCKSGSPHAVLGAGLAFAAGLWAETDVDAGHTSTVTADITAAAAINLRICVRI
jgi:hypothetical protein